MIRKIKSGTYQLLETSNQTKMMILDAKLHYAWVNAGGIGELLVLSEKPAKIDCMLSIGNYRLYDVVDEPKFTDLKHLELSVGKGSWQGYLIPLNLPTPKHPRRRIIPTSEIITRVEY